LIPSLNWVKLRGPFGGVIQTSQGPSPVALDGSFYVPSEDVPTLIAKGAFYAGPPVASVQIGDYLLFVDVDGGLKIKAPDGTLISMVESS